MIWMTVSNRMQAESAHGSNIHDTRPRPLNSGRITLILVGACYRPTRTINADLVYAYRRLDY
jgi:hypothetical protein